MGAKSCARIINQLGFMDKGHFKDIVYSNIFRVLSFLWLLILRLGSLLKLLFRFQVGKASSVHEHKLEDSIGRERETVSSASSSKYEFLPGRGISGFMEEPKTLNFTVHEVSDGLRDGEDISTSLVVREGNEELEFRVPEEKTEDSVLEKTEETGEIEEISGLGEALEVEEPEESGNGYFIGKDDSGKEDIGRNELGSDAGKTEDSVSGFASPETDTAGTDTVEGIPCKEEEVKSVDELSKSELHPEMGLEAENSVSAEARTSSKGSVIEEAEKFNDVDVHEKEEVIGFATEHESLYDHDGKQESVGSNEDLARTSEGVDWFANRSSSEGFQLESPIFTDEDDDDLDRRPDFMKNAEFTDTDEEDYIELKPRYQYSTSSDDEIWSEEDLRELEHKHRDQVLVHGEVDPVSNSHRSSSDFCELENKHKDRVSVDEKLSSMSNSRKSSNFRESEHKHQDQEKDPKPSSGVVKVEHDSQDSNSDPDCTYEHEDIIEQLKMELKNARTGGLPTIQEESETEESSRTPPLIMQELRPLKIQESKFEHRDHMDEIQKVYRSYSDRMRKLDVLNCQTMHALGLYQMKDPYHQFQASRKYWAPAIKSIISHNFFSCKQVANDVVDQSKKAIADLHTDFETSYVGQLSLSWEMLHWQYRKARDLQAHEPPGSHHCYHQVAGEFQHFQVLIHRFIENEAFQGPRVEQYVQSRCVLRNLLQVPVIRDDKPKDKGKREDEGDLITIQMVIDVIEESMRVFWEFLRSDKDDTSNPSPLIYHQPAPISLSDISDLQLLVDVRSNLQKKEKKLKDILRSRNCLVKKFQKHHGGERKHVSLLVAQVELKLVWKVLNLPKISTDQLLWCHEKLDKINLCNKKVSLEPSFLLFPC